MLSTTKYTYTKDRREFGRQCVFADYNEQIIHQPTDKSLFSQYIRRNPVDTGTQLSTSTSGNEVNTENVTCESHGVCHMEGGWPKDVNPLDEEQTFRYRRRIERDEQYDIQLKKISNLMLAKINENNAVSVYQQYFDEPYTDAVEMKTIDIETIRRYIDPIENSRAANHIHFSANGRDMVVSYAITSKTYDEVSKGRTDSFVWNIENSQKSVLTIEANTCLTQLEYNLRDDYKIAGGQLNGCVCIYDTRTGGKIQNESLLEFSHQASVTSLLWVHSKQNTDFFSGSLDGQVHWWDIRSLTKPVDSVQCGAGCSALEFQSTMPSKFSVGTDTGELYYGNRRGTTQYEKLPNKSKCHNSALRSISRNPVADKNILTVGTKAFKIWSEDCRDDCLVACRDQEVALTCGSWNPKRGSTLFIGRADGTLSLWDLLVDPENSVKSIRPSEFAMCDVKCHPNGNIVACSYVNGDVFLLRLSDDLTKITRDERTNVSKMFDREMNREKFLVAKVREIKLNASKAEGGGNDAEGEANEGGDEDEEIIDPEQAIRDIEQDFEEFM